MITARNIYGFKTAICPSAAQLFTERELKTYTFFSDPEFDKEIFRVEADLSVGPSKGELFNHDDFPELGSLPGTTPELLREARLNLYLITQVNADFHEEALSAVRDIMGTFVTRINPLLTWHKVLKCSDAGVAAEGEDASKGYYATELNYDIDFAILPDALAAYLSQ